MDIDRRVERLERRVQRGRMINVMLIVLMGAAILVGAGRSGNDDVTDEVRTRRLVVVDRAGGERATLSVDEANHMVRLRLFSKAGQANEGVVELSAGAEVPVGSGEHPGVRVSATAKGGFLRVSGPGAKNEVHVGASASGSVMLMYPEGKERVALGCEGKGDDARPYLMLCRAGGGPLFLATQADDGDGGISLGSKNGQTAVIRPSGAKWVK